MAIQTTETRYGLGIDIGGTGCKTAIVEFKDFEAPRIVPNSNLEIGSEVASGPEHVVSKVIPDGIRQALANSGIAPRLIAATGIDFPAPVSAKEGIILDKANMKHDDWRNFHAGASAESNLRQLIPGVDASVIMIENDGVAGMAGVASELPIEEQNKLLIGLFVGTGLGGGALLNGNNPFNNVSGGSEPGATHVYYDEGQLLFGRPIGVKNLRLEDFVSITGIERQLQSMHSEGVIPSDHKILTLEAKSGKSEWRVRAESLLGFAHEAFLRSDFEDFSIRVFRAQQEVLGMFLQDKIQWQRPAHIFIGGGVVDSRRVSSEFAQWYVGGIRQTAIDNIHQPQRREFGVPEFHTPKDGDWAQPKGAALLALNKLKSL